MVRHAILFVAVAALSLMLLIPPGASADDGEVVAAGFTTALPASGVALTMWDGASVSTIATEHPNVKSVWVSVSGSLVGYVVGAPEFANGGFLGLYPGGDVAAGTMMIVVVTDEAPTAGPPPAGPIGVENANPATKPSLAQVENYVAWARDHNEELLPRNQRWAAQLNEKIEMLSDPTLAGRIISDGLFQLGSVKSTDGRTITIVGIFPLPEQRSPVIESINYLTSAIPVGEAFMGTPYPSATLYVWDGFIVGNSGGAGRMNMEDRKTYAGRSEILPSILPYEAILAHEMSHAFIGNETLNQFLELYVHNMIVVGSPEISEWEWLRGYVPGDDSNKHIHALLDIYQLLGVDNMSQAYQALYPLRPRYGEPLCSACEQVFVDLAPEQHRVQVGELVAKVDPAR